jgi:hypothetical protein
MRTLPFMLVALALLGACDDVESAAEGDASGRATSDAGSPLPIMDAALALDAQLDASSELSDAAPDRARDASALPYARDVVSFREGAHAGFGRGDYPGVVLGPPYGKGTNAGSLDVLSLGVGGEIVLDFGARSIVDGPGPDFIVFENSFWPGGVAASVFADLGEVAVSDDLETWLTFPCSTQPVSPGVYPGCAGWTPTLAFDPFAVLPLDPARTGGDAFDLFSVGASSARYVRIRDLSTRGEGQAAGFDLDAVGAIHERPR